MPNLEKDTLLYKPYRYVLLQNIWFLGLFDLKTGIDFAHFGLESGKVFEGTVSGFLHKGFKHKPGCISCECKPSHQRAKKCQIKPPLLLVS